MHPFVVVGDDECARYAGVAAAIHHVAADTGFIHQADVDDLGTAGVVLAVGFHVDEDGGRGVVLTGDILGDEPVVAGFDAAQHVHPVIGGAVLVYIRYVAVLVLQPDVGAALETPVRPHHHPLDPGVSEPYVAYLGQRRHGGAGQRDGMGQGVGVGVGQEVGRLGRQAVIHPQGEPQAEIAVVVGVRGDVHAAVAHILRVHPGHRLITGGQWVAVRCDHPPDDVGVVQRQGDGEQIGLDRDRHYAGIGQGGDVARHRQRFQVQHRAGVETAEVGRFAASPLGHTYILIVTPQVDVAGDDLPVGIQHPHRQLRGGQLQSDELRAGDEILALLVHINPPFLGREEVEFFHAVGVKRV